MYNMLEDPLHMGISKNKIEQNRTNMSHECWEIRLDSGGTLSACLKGKIRKKNT